MPKLNSAARKFQAHRSIVNGGKAPSGRFQTKPKKKTGVYSSPILSSSFCNSVFLVMTSLAAAGASLTDFPRLFFAVGNNSTYAISTSSMDDNVDWVEVLLKQGICNASLSVTSQVNKEITKICLEAASGEGGPLMAIFATNATLPVITSGLQCVVDVLNGQCMSDFHRQERMVLVPLLAALLLCCCCLTLCHTLGKRNDSSGDEMSTSFITGSRRP